MAKATDSILPEDTSNVGLDASELRVNFSEEEAGSEARSLEALPGGKYPCTIVEWELKQSGPGAKHPGKPYWALRLRVNDGHKYEGRLFFPNVMLFEGALYSLAQLDKALAGSGSGWGEVTSTGVIPHGDTLIGKEVTAVVTRKVDKYKIEQGEWDPNSGEAKPVKNDVSGFLPISSSAGVTSGSGTLMP